MGIKELNKFLQSNCANGITNTTLHEFNSKKVAIDVSIFLYKFILKEKNIIEGFLAQIYKLRQFNITPVYVFDGIPPKEKDNTIKLRNDRKKNYSLKIEKLNEEYENCLNESKSILIKQELERLRKKNIRITNSHISDLKDMLDKLGIKHVTPESEADTYCSALCSNNIVDFCISDDMDLLASNCSVLVRNFNNFSNNVIKYELDTILSNLDITYRQWLDFCILCGCDYTKRIRGLTPSQAYDLIKKYETIDSIIEKCDTSDIKFPYDFNYNDARNIFLQYSDMKFLRNRFNFNIPYLWGDEFEKIKCYLKKRTNLSYKILDIRLKKIYKIKR